METPTFLCPFCHARLRVGETKWLDKTVACPDCGHLLRFKEVRRATAVTYAEPAKTAEDDFDRSGSTGPKEQPSRLTSLLTLAAASWRWTRDHLSSTWPLCRRWLSNPLVVAWLLAGTVAAALVTASLSLERRSSVPTNVPDRSLPVHEQNSGRASGADVRTGKGSGPRRGSAGATEASSGELSKTMPRVSEASAAASSGRRSANSKKQWPASQEAVNAALSASSSNVGKGMSGPHKGNAAADDAASKILPVSSESLANSNHRRLPVLANSNLPAAAQAQPLHEQSGNSVHSAATVSSTGTTQRSAGNLVSASSAQPATPLTAAVGNKDRQTVDGHAATVAECLQQRILQFKQTEPARLDALLWQVGQMAAVPVAFDPPELRKEVADREVTLSLTNTTVGDILRALAKRVGLEVRVEANRVVLTRSVEPAQATGAGRSSTEGTQISLPKEKSERTPQ